MPRTFHHSNLSAKRLSAAALLAVAAPLVALQLVLLAKVNFGDTNVNVTDYLRPSIESGIEHASNNPHDSKAPVEESNKDATRQQRTSDAFSKQQEILALYTNTSNDSYQPEKNILASRKLFSDIPSTQRKTFYIPCGKACHPMIRAWRVLGWTRVNSMEEAVFIFDHKFDASVPKRMASWQRYNTLLSVSSFYNIWQACYTSKDLPFILKTYRLPDQFDKFKQRLTPNNQEWVLEDYNNKDDFKVLELNSESAAKFEKKIGTIQKSICNAMTWNGRRLNIKVLWFVASTDPLLVFYMDGWANIVGRTKEDAMEEQKIEVSFQELGEMLEMQKVKFDITDPLLHVKKQMKRAIGQVAEVFDKKSEKFKTKAEDSFEFYAADFVVDEDLNVWLTTIEQDLELGEDYYFRLNLNHNLHFGIASILQEIWEKQEMELPLLPVKNNGLWELVYANGWSFDYKETRLPPIKKTDKNCAPKPETA